MEKLVKRFEEVEGRGYECEYIHIDMAKDCALITEDVSVKFARYICVNEWYSSNGLMYGRNFGKEGVTPETKSAKELFKIFLIETS